MSYAFRKVYADLLAPDGTLFVAYLSWVRLLGRWHGRGGVERYGADGARTVLLGGALPPPEQVEREPRSIAVPLSRGALELRYDCPYDGHFPPPPAACPSLTWAVLVPGGRAVATSPDLGRVEGVGYVDWVCLVRPTRLLGLKALTWGRVHAGDATAAFTELELADGRAWRSGALWARQERAPAPASDVVCALDAAGNGRVSLGGQAVELTAERLLHAGDAFGPERVTRRLDRLVARLVGGPTRETRWLGAARIGALRGRAVYERVRFGAAAER